jgi:hypothetical protein
VSNEALHKLINAAQYEQAQARALVSIAESLQRIADSLENVTGCDRLDLPGIRIVQNEE